MNVFFLLILCLLPVISDANVPLPGPTVPQGIDCCCVKPGEYCNIFHDDCHGVNCELDDWPF